MRNRYIKERKYENPGIRIREKITDPDTWPKNIPDPKHCLLYMQPNYQKHIWNVNKKKGWGKAGKN